MLLVGLCPLALPAFGAPPNATTPQRVSQSAGSNVTMDQTVRDEFVPQLGYFFDKLIAEKRQLEMDGVAVFKAKDKFFPGKVALGLSYVVLNLPPQSERQRKYLTEYGNIAALTVDMDNDTWGIYYYLLALRKLKDAGLADQAIPAPILAKLKSQLDWRRFVNQADYTLINLPTNYYGVAFGIARLRVLLGWEEDAASNILLQKTLEHYKRYSGEFGFSDETDGEGRFDRYSILLVAEICQRLVETGLPVPAELKTLLRKAATVALSLSKASGEGFSFGRSIGPYGETSLLEIFSVAAYLDVLTPEEKDFAHAISMRIVDRYLRFWFNPSMHSVDMWNQGRRTDAYRGKHRILGENFSLLHQLIATSQLWAKAGYGNKTARTGLEAWLDKTQPRYHLTWFARGEYDRALAIYRDKGHVFSLLLVNGGQGQHANSPYYPLPFSNSIVQGVADSGFEHPQLLPKFTLADGSKLMGTAFIKNIRSASQDGKHTLDYKQDELTLLGKAAPVKDPRIKLETRYILEHGVITRTDRYTPVSNLDVQDVTLEFASFSEAAAASAHKVTFGRGDVTAFELKGIGRCGVRAANGEDAYKSPVGPMKTVVSCSSGPFTMNAPLTIEWKIHYK
jgi:hypothetical protein